MLASAHRWLAVPGGGADPVALARGSRPAAAIATGRPVTRLADLPPTGSPCSTRRRARGRHRGRAAAGPLRRRLAGSGRGRACSRSTWRSTGRSWRAVELGRVRTVHLGGTLEEIADGEAAVHAGRLRDRPFVLLVKPSLFDPTRAPAGRHVVWAYCHVPNGALTDMTDAILRQVERFAPGFRDRILAVATRGPADLEAANRNDVGGDIAGGRMDLGQLFTRPSLRLFDPYSTPDPALFLCSASTPPGGGVHGMCGFHAARSALRRLG
jgi:hypothetical protein